MRDTTLGAAQQKVDLEAARLTNAGDLDLAQKLESEINRLKQRLGYSSSGLVRGNAASIPAEITITRRLSLEINLLGQTKVSLDLNPGETYKTHGIIGDSIVIQVGNNSVTVPISSTDLSDRVAAVTKGLQYSPGNEAGNNEIAGNFGNANQQGSPSPFDPSDWRSVRPLNGSDVNFFADRIELHSRGTIISKRNFTSPTIDLSGRFNDSGDVLDIFLRSNERRTNPFGAPDQGLVIHLDMPTGSLSAFTWNSTGDGRQDLATTPLGLSPGSPFELKVIDDGLNCRVYLNNFAAPKLSFRSSRAFGSKVIIQNREGGHRFTIDKLHLYGR